MIVLAVGGLFIGCSKDQTSAKDQKVKILYVWAPSGLMLRKTPSPSGKIIKALPYGTRVITLKQDKRISFNYNFYSSKDTSHSLTQVSSTRSKVVLEGYWLKVKFGRLKGYLFNKFLLKYLPKRKKESIVSYLVRVFHLDNKKVKKVFLTGGCGGKNDKKIKYPVTSTTYISSKNNVILKLEKHGGNACTMGRGRTVVIPQMSFSQAFVFLHTILPPLAELGFEYKKNKMWRYAIDQMPNKVKLVKAKNGILIDWFYGVN